MPDSARDRRENHNAISPRDTAKKVRLTDPNHLDISPEESVNPEDIIGGPPEMTNLEINPTVAAQMSITGPDHPTRDSELGGPPADPMTAFAASLTPKRAISYLRVSTKRQAEKGGEGEGFSIPAQRDANRKKAQSMGALVVKEFVDRGESARSVNRPQLQAMLQYIEENQVDYLVVHKLDRLARSREDDVAIGRRLAAAGVTLVSTTESIDQTPSGMLLHGIMATIAEFYSRNLANEVIKGMSQKTRRGGTSGRAPLGYRNVGQIDEDGREIRTVAIDPERAEHIAWAFREYAKGGRSLKDIADDLTARGVRTLRTPRMPSKLLDESALQKLLVNPYYTGLVQFQGVTYPGRHQPLIDEATFQTVQTMLATRRVGERRRVHDHYLKSTLRCGLCGARLIAQVTTNRHGTTYSYFVCNGRLGKKNGCEMRSVLMDEVEAQVEAHYRDIHRLITPAVRISAEKAVVDEFRASRREATAAMKRLATERERLEREQGRLLQAHYADAIPLDLLKREQDRIAATLRDNERQTKIYAEEGQASEKTLRLALDLLEDCSRAYAIAPDHLRKLFNQVFFESILVLPEGGSRSTFEEPFGTLVAVAHSLKRRQEGDDQKGRATRVARPSKVLPNDAPQPNPASSSSWKGFGKTLLVRLMHRYSNLSPGLLSPVELMGRALTSSRLTDRAPRKRPARQLREREVDAVVELYAQSRNVRAVASELQMSRNTITKHLASRGIDTSKSMSRDEVARAVRLYESGVSSGAIGSQLGYDNHTIIKELRKERVRIRPRSGRGG